MNRRFDSIEQKLDAICASAERALRHHEGILNTRIRDVERRLDSRASA
jgi:hypothetical protein